MVCSLWYFVYSSWIVRLAFFIMHNSSLGFGTLYIRLLTSLSLCFSSSWSALSFSASSAWMITSHVYSTRPHYHHHPILRIPFHHGEHHLISGWLWLFQPASRAGRKWRICGNLRGNNSEWSQPGRKPKLMSPWLSFVVVCCCCCFVVIWCCLVGTCLLMLMLVLVLFIVVCCCFWYVLAYALNSFCFVWPSHLFVQDRSSGWWSGRLRTSCFHNSSWKGAWSDLLYKGRGQLKKKRFLSGIARIT